MLPKKAKEKGAKKLLGPAKGAKYVNPNTGKHIGIASNDQLKDRALSQLSTAGSLGQLDHDKIPLDSFIIVVGKRRYGKSTWAQGVLSKKWVYFRDAAYVFT